MILSDKTLCNSLPPVETWMNNGMMPVTKENYKISTPDLFRWIYIPYIVSEIMRDYLDTCYIVSSILKKPELKKIIRTLKETDEQYVWDRKKSFEDRVCKVEREEAIKIEDNINDTLCLIGKRLYADIEKAIPGTSLDMKMFIGAGYMAYFIHTAISSYVLMHTNNIMEKYNYKITKNIMPKSFFLIGEYLKILNSVYVKIDPDMVKIYSQEWKTIMNSIRLYENGNELSYA